MNLKLSKESREWLKKIAMEEKISEEELISLSVEKFISEYRLRRAIREYVEDKVSLGKASEIAGVSKRKFMVILEDLGIPLNVSSDDFIKGLKVLSKLREKL